MIESERQPISAPRFSLHVTPKEAKRMIPWIEEKMERVDEIVEEQLQLACYNRFRIMETSLEELEAAPETAAGLRIVRQQLTVSYLEKFANIIRDLRSRASGQIQA